MDTRELLILLLGLAVVGVILRGLYVAIQTRRGQLRLAIEKNIPRVDLDTLEMAELPGGGARVVQRSLNQVNHHNRTIEAAEARARKLDLGAGDEPRDIPLLMEAVELAGAGESADDILLDYPDGESRTDADGFAGKGDNLHTVAPDYYDDDPDPSEGVGEDYGEYPDGAAAIESDSGHRREPTLNLEGSFEDQLDAFSMTAGERIGGGEGEGAATGAGAPSDETGAEPVPTTSGLGTLLAPFKRRNRGAGPAARGAEGDAQGRTMPDARTATASDAERETGIGHGAPASGPSEILVINVMAPEGHSFAGNDLLQVLIGAGLKFGDMDIFHQRLGAGDRSPVIFSVANILNPGTFDLNNMERFTSPGVSLFLAMPAAINNLDALERMLKAAHQIGAALGGELRDDRRNGMTEQTIGHYRQRVHDFELRRLKSAASRG